MQRHAVRPARGRSAARVALARVAEDRALDHVERGDHQEGTSMDHARRAAEEPPARDGVRVCDRRRPRADRPRRRVRGAVVAVRRPARAAADRPALDLRARAPGADRPRARAAGRLPPHGRFLLGDVVEADDAYTGVHSRDVVDLAMGVADELELGSATGATLEFAALLHDVGKVRIPNEIINKPGPLTRRGAQGDGAPHGRGRAAAAARRRPARRDRARRALVPRALGRRAAIPTASPASGSRCWRGSSLAATPTTR